MLFRSGESALEALLDGKGIGRESRVVRMLCAGWFGLWARRCTLKTYSQYAGLPLLYALHTTMVQRPYRVRAQGQEIVAHRAHA